MSTPLFLLLSAAYADPVQQGVWVLTDEPAALERQVSTQIHELTAAQFFGVRRLTRKVLTRATAPCQAYALHARGEVATIQCDTQAAASAPVTGQPVDFRGDDGRRLALEVRQVSDEVLIQRFSSRQGVRQNRFMWSNQGEELTVEVTISSSWLPEPFEYALHYTRH